MYCLRHKSVSLLVFLGWVGYVFLKKNERRSRDSRISGDEVPPPPKKAIAP